MSYKRGSGTPWYVRRISTPISPDMPKAIGIDEVYLRDKDPSRLIVATMCNDMSTANYVKGMGEKRRGAGIYLDEIPPENFRFIFLGREHFDVARRVHEPKTRYEGSLNGEFYGFMTQIDTTSVLLYNLMDLDKDRSHVAGFFRPNHVKRGIIDRLSRLSGQDIEPRSVECRLGADLSIPIVRGADELGHQLRYSFESYPDQMIEFTPEDLIELNLTRHERREMRSFGEYSTAAVPA